MVLDLLVTRPCVSLVLFLYVFSEDFFRVMTTFYCWSDLVRISLKYVTFSGSSCEKFHKIPLCCFHTPPDGKKILKSRLKGLHMFCSWYTILEIYCTPPCVRNFYGPEKMLGFHSTSFWSSSEMKIKYNIQYLWWKKLFINYSLISWRKDV